MDWITELYITEGTNAYFSANLLGKVDSVTHTMFIGEVTNRTNDLKILDNQ